MERSDSQVIPVASDKTISYPWRALGEKFPQPSRPPIPQGEEGLGPHNPWQPIPPPPPLPNAHRIPLPRALGPPNGDVFQAAQPWEWGAFPLWTKAGCQKPKQLYCFSSFFPSSSKLEMSTTREKHAHRDIFLNSLAACRGSCQQKQVQLPGGVYVSGEPAAEAPLGTRGSAHDR